MKLSDRDWKPIRIIDIFDLKRGREGNMVDLSKGNIPLISAKNSNNGLKKFVKEQKTIINGNCITLNNDGDGGAGLAYYQPHKMALDTHVTALIPRNNCISKNSLLFISVCISKLHGFFGHGYSISNPRAEKIKIMLPVTDIGEPDYQFMDGYIREMMVYKKQKYEQKLNLRIKELTPENKEEPIISKKIWNAIPITQLFQKLEPGKGKGLNHLKQCRNGIPYIGATNRNNGVVCFVEDNKASHKMIQQGNCIGFIKNGDGSAGFAIYRKEPFISTSDVIFGYASWLNVYTGLFFVAAQDMIEQKYSHGYKRNKAHLRGDRVMLPVTATGEPDYSFMEQYGKTLLARKYKQYLDYLESKDPV